jgi:hypothetical protein
MEFTEIKHCNECGNDYPKTEEYFYKQNTKHGKIILKSECKTCTKNRYKSWREENPKKRKENYKRQNSKEKKLYNIKKKNKERRENGKYGEWQRNNPEKIKKYNKNHTKKKHKINEQEWNNCKAYFNNICAYCGMTEKEHRKIYKQDLHKEHVIDDGRNDLKNCVPSCKICNSEKHETSLNNWYNKNNIKYDYEKYYQIYLWLRYDCLKYIKKKNKRKNRS